MSARPQQRKPWFHGPSGFWCAQIAGKRHYLDRDPDVAQRKFKKLLQDLRRGDGPEREWLDAYFSDLADVFLDDVKARKKPATYRSYTEMLTLAQKHLGIPGKPEVAGVSGPATTPAHGGDAVSANQLADLSESEVLAEIRSVVQRAKKGDTTIQPRLRELLPEHPALWQRSGDLAARAEAAWSNLISGQDLHLQEAVLRQATDLRAQLYGQSPSSPVTRLVVERAVIAWLQLHYFETAEADATAQGESPRVAAYRGKRQEQAQRMFLTALAAVTTLRKLLPSAPSPAASTAALGVPAHVADKNHENGDNSSTAPASNRLAVFFEQLTSTTAEKDPCPQSGIFEGLSE
jgi:hypothetical protein